MKKAKRRKHWHPNRTERILIGIVLALLLTLLSLVCAPALASFGAERVPNNTPLIRPLPLRP